MRPFFGIIKLWFELIGQLLLGKISVFLFLILYPIGIAAVKAVLIPFGIFTFFAVARNGIDSPMDEDAEFGVHIPLGDGPLVKGYPVRLIVLGINTGGSGACHQGSNGKDAFCHVSF
jgi:hypothetical protein